MKGKEKIPAPSNSEYEKAVKEKGFEFVFNKAYETLNNCLDKYEKKNPEWIKITFLQLVYGAILSLKTYIENPEEKEITWESPFVELQYPVKMDWEDLSPYYFEITEKDIKDFDYTAELITEGFFNIKQAHILRELTNDIALLKKRDYYTVLLTEEVRKKVNRLAKSRREARIKKLSQKKFTFDFPGVVIDNKGKERKFKGTLTIQFNALLIDQENKEAYYPIQTGFEFKGYSPSLWTEKAKRDFWDIWLQSLKEAIPKEDLDLELQPLPEPRVKAITQEVLHRQSRSYLKTAGALVKKDTTQPSLFDLPYYEEEILTKEALSQKTAITGNYLFMLWQRGERNREGNVTIDNLSQIARELDTNPQDLKIYLLYLGGYQYPVIIKDEKTRELTFYQDKIFYVKFIYDDKYDPENIDESLRVGTKFLYFIKNTPVKRIEFRPSKTYIEEIERRGGLGNILVTDAMIAFALGLTTMAYKLLVFTGSSRPKGKNMPFDNIIKPQFLNLRDQVRRQGKPRVLRRIKEGFTELQEKGHLEYWSYDPPKDTFAWEYTPLIFKHGSFLKAKQQQKL